jgi:cardiolipin synthase (CMP-forming)
LLANKYYVSVSIILVIIWLTDILDGYFARKRNEVSEIGKLIDPLADKFAIFIFVLFLLIQGVIPLWFFTVIVIRDILILTGGIFIKKKKSFLLQSNYFGKIAVFFIGFTILNLLILAIFKQNYDNNNILVLIWELFSNILIFISLGISLISLTNYLIRFLQILKEG